MKIIKQKCLDALTNILCVPVIEEYVLKVSFSNGTPPIIGTFCILGKVLSFAVQFAPAIHFCDLTMRKLDKWKTQL